MHLSISRVIQPNGKTLLTTIAQVQDFTERKKAEEELIRRSDGQPKPLTDDIRIILFQSVRELVVNILKHSNAKSVIVSIKRDGDYLQFTIKDDGVGFDTSRLVALKVLVSLIFVNE